MVSREERILRQRERDERYKHMEEEGIATRVTYKEKENKVSHPNGKSEFRTPEEEIKDRQAKAEKTTIVYRQMLPNLLKKLNKIEDLKQTKNVKHKLTVLMALVFCPLSIKSVQKKYK